MIQGLQRDEKLILKLYIKVESAGGSCLVVSDSLGCHELQLQIGSSVHDFPGKKEMATY